MPNTGHFDSQAVFPTTTRKARSSDVPIEDRFVGYSYIEATFGHGFGRTSIWRRVREGNFPKPTLIGNQNKWRKPVQSINVDREERIKLIAIVPEKSATTEDWLKAIGEHRVIEHQPTDLESTE